MTKEFLNAVDSVLNGVSVFSAAPGKEDISDFGETVGKTVILLETLKDGSKVFAVRNEVYQWADKNAQITREFSDSFPLSLPDDVKYFFRLAARCDYTAHVNLEILLPGLLDIGSGGVEWARIIPRFICSGSALFLIGVCGMHSERGMTARHGTWCIPTRRSRTRRRQKDHRCITRSRNGWNTSLDAAAGRP